MKLYTDMAQITCGRLNTYLSDILRAFVRPSANEDTGGRNYAGLNGRQDRYHLGSQAHVLVDSVEEADVVILPFQWNYYLKQKNTAPAEKLFNLAAQKGKPVAVWIGNDLGVRFPHSGMHVFRNGAYRSKLNGHEFVLPYFIHDPLSELALDEPPLREKESLPVIGFCGESRISTGRLLRECGRNAVHNTKCRLRLIPDEPNAIVPGTYIRQNALGILETSPRVRANFIRRDKRYLGPGQAKVTEAGAEKKQRMRKAFLDNIIESDYTLCVRGLGNFSIRLFETLAMGRIPLIVDTDCVLPFEQTIPWKEHSVIIPRREMSRLPDAVADFHERLDPDQFTELQVRNRQLWRDFLTYEGFNNHFHLHFAAGSLPNASMAAS